MSSAPSGDDPFANLPMFAEVARALAGQGPLNWDVARQFAALAAGAAGEANVDPLARVRLGELARIVELHVADLTGTDGAFATITPVTRSTWAQRTLDAYRPLFTDLATSLSRESGDGAADPMASMMAGLTRMMGPAMMGMAVGSMVGRLSARTFGQYDLPVPRSTAEVMIVPANIDEFAAAWGLEVDEMRLWVLSQELTAHALFSHAALRDQLLSLVGSYVAGFHPDPSAVAEHLGELQLTDLGDPMAAMQRLLGDPALLLGAVESAAQRELGPRLDAALAAVVGFVDYVVDGVAVRVIGGDALRVAEAIRRRRVEASPDDVFVERLLGLRLTDRLVQRGKNFIGGVVDRVGEDRLGSLFASPEPLPTPAEIEAPGLWIARLEL